MNPRQVRLHRYAILVACGTFLLVIAGGLVTSTGSALAVPDWPLSFGTLFPRMEGGVLFEHGHRMIAGTVALMTVGLAVWTSRVEPRGWVRRLAWAMLGVVVVQAAFGGVTVLLRLPTAVAVAHAGLAQIFFALTVVMAGVTGRQDGGTGGLRSSETGAPARLAMLAVGIVYAQVLMGAVVRHTGAGLAIPDFPLAYGRLIPPFENRLIAWQFAHRVGAVIACVAVAAAAVGALRGRAAPPALPAALLGLLALQVLLGALTIWSQRAVVPTTAHVATGALLFGGTVLLAVEAAGRPSAGGGRQAAAGPSTAEAGVR